MKRIFLAVVFVFAALSPIVATSLKAEAKIMDIKKIAGKTPAVKTK